ncbi:AAEL009388-PA [Aedes aegypti]|uniref:Coiled-coil domain-containing protein 22 homolog n=1 Tax=Aedes aegypti TaxID=7159 RepID=CCD22_AEDAE|nr:coiled-coil domain-containing protein 22 homolog [Aedes aegypti]XP_021708648.1 coiled-coil domain-containing protein 22 homolog [Aedes aegypti]XP_021708649.1 coiled-coil domain-containing protein 22 homolog [Aedes aegypti]Q16VW9.1 RecName: Full=Coiled-coil domain-containing protein 22 homolog [Aedes aegypti]EAT38744.1 AAEL009388-PA [Aedes aegypti]
MDEIDNIILHSLRQIECNLDEEVISLDDLSPSMLVQVVSKCISLIDPGLELPRTLPPGMAQRFTATASLAEACRTIGYRRDIGYQTFLYSNVAEVRRVLMFLVEKLPKEAADKTSGSGQPVDSATQLENRILSSLQSQLQAPWMPEFCQVGRPEGLSTTSGGESPAQIAFRRFIPRKISVPFVTQGDVAAEVKEFWSRRNLDCLDEGSLVPSLIAANDGAIKTNAKGAIDEVDRQVKLPAINEKLLQYYSKGGTKHRLAEPSGAAASSGTTEKVVLNNITVETKPGKTPLESLQEEIDALQQEIVQHSEEGVQLESSRKETDESIEEYRKTIVRLKEEKKIKERTHILLEDPEVNVKKLEAIIAAGGERMKKLQDQWDAHRIPLVDTLEAYRLKNSDKLSKSQQVLDQIESTRQKCEEVVIDLQTKGAMYARLQKEFEKLNKTVSRTAYTSRILEIIGNIRKQKNGIDQILQDTRSLQKEINNITGQLDRQFTVTDDLIFRNAKKDEHSKRAYKLLVTLHSDCEELIKLVQETGAIKREVRDLEDQIENEKGRNTAANLAQITHDLTEMQNESQRLEESIRRMEVTSRQ